jgi:hypothetical protein
MSARGLLLCAALVCSACARAEIDLTVGFDASIDSDRLSRIGELVIQVSGAETFSTTLLITDGVRAMRQARTVYRAGRTDGVLQFAVDARDGAGVVLARGMQSGTLEARKGVPVQVVLSRFDGPPPDMTMPSDLAVPDLAGADLTVSDANVVQTACNQGIPYLLCEDFESGMVSAAKWNQNASPPNTVLTVSTAQHHRGQYALRLQIHAPDMGAFLDNWIEQRSTFPRDTLYVRAFVLLPSTTTVPPLGLGMMQVRQTTGPGKQANVELLAGRAIHQAHDLVPPAMKSSATVMPLDTWTCVEWRVHHAADAGTAELRVWVNGVELADAALLGAMQDTPWGLLRLGPVAQAPPSAPTIEMWFDEIAVHHSPIGCGP